LLDSLSYYSKVVFSERVPEERMTRGHCFKYQKKRESKTHKDMTLKNGKPATQVVCPNCGTAVCRIGME
jgi:predicted RNA-binding Zn-ribbon protein involved in translation (DUF1610 family)